MILIVSTVSGGVQIAYRVSTDILEQANTTRDETSATYTKKKEIAGNKLGYSTPTTLRVTFGLWSPSATSSAYGRVYRNGAAVGTERVTALTSEQTYTEDISGWSPGDLIQLYCRHSTGTDPARCANFRVLGLIDSTTYNADAFTTNLD